MFSVFLVLQYIYASFTFAILLYFSKLQLFCVFVEHFQIRHGKLRA